MNPPPPPPPPNPAKLMQMMVENQRLLTKTINQMDNQGGRNAQNGPAPNQYSSFKDFMDTKPPSFRKAEEPLQAEEWLNMMEQKFRLLRLKDSLCNIPDDTITEIRIMASSVLHSIVIKHTLMHQLKMSLIWLNVLRELKGVYLVY